MKVIWLLLFMTTALFGCTEHTAFADRVAQAKAYEESEELRSFFSGYWRQIEAHSNTALEQCFPLDKVKYEHATLVADLLPDRSLSNIQVRPNDQMTQCFATHFAAAPFPPPPQSLGPSGLPIRAEIALQPSRSAP